MFLYRKDYDVSESDLEYYFLITDLKWFQIRLYSEGYLLTFGNKSILL